jgi:hypothetical protein
MVTAQNVTAFEKTLLTSVKESEYHDGQDPVDNPVWADCVLDLIPTKSRGGVMSSLVKKGWVRFHDCGADSTVTLTAEGLRVLRG